MTIETATRAACVCGCGGFPAGKKARFLPGHDARYHAAQKRAIQPAVEQPVVPIAPIRPRVASTHQGLRIMGEPPRAKRSDRHCQQCNVPFAAHVEAGHAFVEKSA